MRAHRRPAAGRAVRRPTGPVRARRRVGRRGGRVRVVVPQLLHLARRARRLPGRSLRTAGAPGARPGPGAAGPAGRRSASSAATAGWSGRCWTGTPRRSASTAGSARSPWTTGRLTGWRCRARHPCDSGRRRPTRAWRALIGGGGPAPMCRVPAWLRALVVPVRRLEVHPPGPGRLADQQQECGHHHRTRGDAESQLVGRPEQRVDHRQQQQLGHDRRRPGPPPTADQAGRDGQHGAADDQEVAGAGPEAAPRAGIRSQREPDVQHRRAHAGQPLQPDQAAGPAASAAARRPLADFRCSPVRE